MLRRQHQHQHQPQHSTSSLRLVVLLAWLVHLFQLVRSMWIIDYQIYSTLVGNPISLPCNITPPTADDGVSLILWYREDLPTPIYTVDSRSSMQLAGAKHFFDATVLSSRATFNITAPISYLQFRPSVATDTAEYRCRVDFRRGRTINRVMQLNVIVPPQKVSIVDAFGNQVNDIAGPFNEDDRLNITCQSKGGHPLPTIKWWRGDELLSERVQAASKVQQQSVSNVLQFAQLQREHLMMPLTCEVSNTNLTSPVTRTILVDLNLKPTKVQIIRPLANITIGERVELVCQASGSRPPAKISWRLASKQLEHVSESTSDDGTVTTNFLAFVPSPEDNGKVLTCAAFNPQFRGFQIEDHLSLDIHYSPIVSLLLGASVQRQEIVEDTDVFFDCNIQANPAVHQFGWLWNGNELKETRRHRKKTSDDQDGDGGGDGDDDDDDDRHDRAQEAMRQGMLIRNNSIVIHNVNRAHSGRYQCWAQNVRGKASSEVVTLDVKYAPRCTTHEATFVHTSPYEPITIRCAVEANPEEVEFFWEFNSTTTTEVGQANDNDNDNNVQRSMDISNTKLASELRFTPKTGADFGLVYCYARNRIGQQKEPCVFHISRSEVPESPQNCSLANITMASLVVHCSTESYPKTDLSRLYVLEIYNDENGLLLKNLSATAASTSAARFNVTDLPPGYSFSLVLYAADANGQSDKVHLRANTLVGEPRKLEHIEQHMATKPVLVLALLLIGLLAVGLALVVVFARLRHRNKTARQSRESCSVFDTDNAEAVNESTTNKQAKKRNQIGRKKMTTTTVTAATTTTTTTTPSTPTSRPSSALRLSTTSPPSSPQPDLYRTLLRRRRQEQAAAAAEEEMIGDAICSGVGGGTPSTVDIVATATTTTTPEMIALDRLTPEHYNANRSMLNCLSTTDDMIPVNSYLELTDFTTNTATLLGPVGSTGPSTQFYPYYEHPVSMAPTTTNTPSHHHVSICNDLPGPTDFVQYSPSADHGHGQQHGVANNTSNPKCTLVATGPSAVYLSHDQLCAASIPCILLNDDNNVYFSGATAAVAPPESSVSSASLTELNQSLLEVVNATAVDVSVSGGGGAQYTYELSPPLSLANGSVCDQSLSSPSAASSSASSSAAAAAAATAAANNNTNPKPNNQMPKSATKVRFCE